MLTRLTCSFPVWTSDEKGFCPQAFEDLRQVWERSAACPGGTGWGKDSAEDTARASIRAEPAEIRRLQGEVVPTDKEPALTNPAANFASGTGQHHEVSATWSPGQKQTYRAGANWRLAIGVEPEITSWNTLSHLRA